MKRTAQLRIQAFAGVAVALLAASMLTLDDAGETRVAGLLGPTPGPNSAGHVQAKRSYLERITRERPEDRSGALVSFTRFVTASEATSMMSGMHQAVVFVRFPEGQPEALALSEPLAETVAARAGELADAVTGEIAALEAQLEAAGPSERETLQDSLERRREALGSLGPNCACVYAVGVEDAALSALLQLHGRPDVLLVDAPDPVRSSLQGFNLTPILPGGSA